MSPPGRPEGKDRSAAQQGGSPANWPRSYLFVPGNRPERFDKALGSGADAVIVDLEDAVPPAAKDAARTTVAAWLAATHPVVLRINADDTPWFAADLALCRAAEPGALAAVMVAKSERAEVLASLAMPVPLLPLIESAAGFDQARAIAGVPGVQRLAFGAIDFQRDLGLQSGFDELTHFRSQLVLVSRLANVAPPIDSPSVVLDDPAAVLQEARAGRRLGFGAKLCIHPRQVEAVHRAFAPGEAELAWARRVVDAARASGGAAVALDGTMVDRPVIAHAEAVLAAGVQPSLSLE